MPLLGAGGLQALLEVLDYGGHAGGEPELRCLQADSFLFACQAEMPCGGSQFLDSLKLDGIELRGGQALRLQGLVLLLGLANRVLLIEAL